jgi:hypothetical protein
MWYRGFGMLVLEERTKSPELILHANSKVLGQTSRSTLLLVTLSLALSQLLSLSHSPTQAQVYIGCGQSRQWGLSPPPLSHSLLLSLSSSSLCLSQSLTHMSTRAAGLRRSRKWALVSDTSLSPPFSHTVCGPEQEYEVGFSLMDLNHDGFIDKDEFNALPGALSPLI